MKKQTPHPLTPAQLRVLCELREKVGLIADNIDLIIKHSITDEDFSKLLRRYERALASNLEFVRLVTSLTHLTKSIPQ